MKRVGLIAVLMICSCAPRLPAFDYVIEYGTKAVNYPYSTQTQPAKNGSYVDSAFHTAVTRVSDKAIDNYTGARLITGYSTFSGVSSDGKYILLMMCDSSSKYALYNAATNAFVKDLGLQSWNGDPEPRWDRSGSHPSWLYYVRQGRLMRMDVDNADPLGTSVMVHDFTVDYPACAYIKNDEEGDCSADSRYWIFQLRNSSWNIIRIVTYDMQTNTILGSLTSFPYDINCVSVSPNGKYFLVDWQFAPHGTNSGPKVYNSNFTLACPSEVKNEATHWCWATMADGHTAVVSQNNGTNYGGGQRAADAIQVFDIECNTRSYIMYLADMGWNSGFHFFNTGKPGWAGMYVISAPNDPSHSYWDYDQIYLMELKNNGRVFRVTFSQHRYTGDYFDEGHAQMDWHRTGTKLWFNANWRGTDNAEVYRVDLPVHWYEDLAGLSYADSNPPYTTGHAPAKNATNVTVNANISVDILDDISGVNLSSAVLRVNGFTVYSGSAPAAYQNTTVSGTNSHYVFTYNPPADFNYSQVVNVTVDAQDLSTPPNVMTRDSYSFTTAGAPPLNAPSNLKAISISTTAISLMWTDNNASETGFRVERRTGTGGTYSQIADIGANAVTFDDSGLNPATTYYYRVRTYNGVSGNSIYSNASSTVTFAVSSPVIVPLNAPLSLLATAVSTGVITLSWTDNNTNEAGFRIERKIEAGGTYSQIAIIGANSVGYTDGDLMPATTYYYRIRAYNDASGNSAYSTESFAVTQVSEAGGGGSGVSTGTGTGTGPGGVNQPAVVVSSSGEVKIVGSAKNRGIINPDEGDSAKIFFKGNDIGTFECRIFTLTGELVWQDAKQNVSEGMFEWIPNDIASGGYVAYVKGPGINSKKKIAVLR